MPYEFCSLGFIRLGGASPVSVGRPARGKRPKVKAGRKAARRR